MPARMMHYAPTTSYHNQTMPKITTITFFSLRMPATDVQNPKTPKPLSHYHVTLAATPYKHAHFR